MAEGNFNSQYIWGRIYMYRDYSYKYYEFLSEKDKETLDKAGLEPELKLFALKLIKSGFVLNYAINFIKSGYYEDYIKWWLNRDIDQYKRKPLSEKQYIKELKFRGFIPLEDFKLKTKYDYIITNRPILGKHWVYPEHFSGNYKYLSKKKNPKRDIHKYFGLIGIAGITRIKYSKNGQE